MKLDNKGFLLYETLLSLIVLCTFIGFYTILIQEVQTQKYYNKIEFEAIMAFRESIYFKYQNGTYIEFNDEKYYSKVLGDSYCIIYERYNDEEQICT